MEVFLSFLILTSFTCIPIFLLSATIKKFRKKPVKKSLKIVTISLIVFITATVIDAYIYIASDKNDVIENSSNETAISKFLDEAEYIDGNQYIIPLSNFEHERAWVQLNEPKGQRAALIDTQGRILWKSELTNSEYALVEASIFRDGLAYCLFNGDDKDIYIILDSDGNVTFTKESDENYIFLSHGNGQFLIAKHILDFDSNEWEIGAIDKNGNTVVPFVTYETTPPFGVNSSYYTPWKVSFDEKYYHSCNYMGDNVYQLFIMNEEQKFCSTEILLNIETQDIIYTFERSGTVNGNSDYEETAIEFLSKFENGVAKVFHKYNSYDEVNYMSETISEVCTLTTNGVLTPIINNDWTNDILSTRGEQYLGFSEGTLYLDYSPNRSLFPSGAYYNLEGKCILDFPKYRDKYYYLCGAFHNGYAVMNITGVDGKHYITAFDKQGNFMFDPIPGFDAGGSSDGKYIIAIKEGCITIFDINGMPLYSVECSCISMDEINVISIGNGVVTIKDIYINLEDGIVIGKHQDAFSEMNITRYFD